MGADGSKPKKAEAEQKAEAKATPVEPKAEPKAQPKAEPKDEPKVETTTEKKTPPSKPAEEPKAAESTTEKQTPPSKPSEEPKAAESTTEKKTAPATTEKKSGKGKAKGEKGDKEKGARLCVRNLVEDMTRDKFSSLFEVFGNVQSVQLKTNTEGKCRGFGFLTFDSEEAASKAIAEMHDKDVDGKKLNVVLADSNKKEGEGAKGEKGKGKGKNEGKGKGKGKKATAADVGYAPPYPYGQQPAYPYSYGYGYGYGQQDAQYQQYYLQQMAMYQAYAHAAAMSPKGSQGQASFFPTAVSEKEYAGTLKSFSERNGYGMIACEETKKLYNRDVYVGGEALPTKEVGAKLKFTIKINEKGHPAALTVTLP